MEDGMADYHRFVAYIYEYVNGKKMQNTGFAKIELRNAICRIQIHIQNVRMMDGNVQTFGIVRQPKESRKNNPIILLIGEGQTQGSGFDRRFTVPEEPFVEESYRFEQVCGIYIRSQSGRNWMTVFDDEPIAIENLGKPEEAVAEPEEKTEEKTVKENEPEESESSEEKINPDIPEYVKAEPEITSEEIKEEILPDETAEEIPPKETMEESESESRIKSAEKENKCKGCEPGTDTRWNRATARYVHFQPVQDEKIEDAIRIQPSDLKILWQKGLRQGSNSFLMHGYYQHQHLMIGKNKEGVYVLGVPGFYGEKNMAEMFGFPEFRKAKAEQRMGTEEQTFGYWCKNLE